MDISADRATLEFLQGQLGRAERFEEVATPEGGMVTLFDRQMHLPPAPRKAPAPEPFEVRTLGALVDYFGSGIDSLKASEFVVHVVEPNRVDLLGKLSEHHRQRELLCSARYPQPALGYIGSWSDLETLVIGLMTTFTGHGDREAVMSLLKSVSSEGAELREDDGVSQQVSVKRGVHVKERAKTPNPVTLGPFRAFPEVPQPESKFILRLRDKGGIQACLIEADGGGWKLEAVQSVATHLRSLLGESELKVIC